MTVSDPLIKQLKGYVKTFTESGKEITDENPSLLPFCECLEKCLQKGVAVRLNSIGIPNFLDAWSWMEDISKVSIESLYSYSSVVDSVRDNQKVTDGVGKFRLLIRSCLNRKCLHQPVGYIIRTTNLSSLYYNDNGSIIGNDILAEIFYSCLLQLGCLTFKLNLKNSSFLDETWELPKIVVAKFVPCKTLGISVCFTRGKALIIQIEKNSVTAEDERIQVGDVLDEINGQFVSSYTRGNLKRILFKAVGQPMTVCVAKFRNENTGGFYSPIAKMIKDSEIDYMKALLTQEIDHKPEPDEKPTASEEKPGHIIFAYCGSIEIGRIGDVEQIEGAIKNFLDSNEDQKVPVRFECMELGINVNEETSKKLLFNYSYMEISSCGRSSKFPDHFAFITGDPNHVGTTNFKVHVFYHPNEDEVLTLLQTLGQGFQRTNFVV